MPARPLRTMAMAVALLASARASSAGEVRGRVLVDGRPAGAVTVAAVPFEDGLAAARREVRREKDPPPIATTATRPDGTFALSLSATSGPVPDAVRLSLSGDAVVPVVLGRLVDGAGEDLEDLRVEGARSLAGRVVDPRGGPVVGATVTLRAGASRRPFDDEFTPAETVPQIATTRADGTFEFARAATEGNHLRVEAPAFAVAERGAVRAGALARPIALELGGVVRGRVMLPDGRSPAPGALVRFEGRASTRWTEARPDGSFLIEGVPPGAGSVVADAGVRGRGTAAVAASRGEAVVVGLAPTAGLAGHVVDADSGKPLSGVRLEATGSSGFLDRSARDGGYAFASLAPGRYLLRADDGRYVQWTRTVTVTAGQVERQDVPLVRAASLAGSVVDERGAPIAGAKVVVAPGTEERLGAFRRRLEGRDAGVRSRGDGSFELSRIRPGDNLRLDVSHDEYEDRSVAGISVAAGARRSGVRVVLRRGLSVRGIVRDRNERPVAGVEVRLSRELRVSGGQRGMRFGMVGPPTEIRRETGPDGRFEFRGLKAGEYSLRASRPGYATVSRDALDVDDGRPEGEVELVLAPGATLSGFVHDRSGNGAPGWMVTAQSSADSGGGGRPFGLGGLGSEARTEDDGSFLIEGAVEGETYTLQALGPSGLGPRLADVTAPAADLELVVSGSGQIAGRVQDADSGRAVTDFEVSYVPDSSGGIRFFVRAGPGGGPGQPQTVHAEDGTFLLENVPAGRWSVEVRAEGYQQGSAAGVVVDEGGLVEGVDVRLSRGHVLTGQVVESGTGRPVLDATVSAELSGGGARGGFRMMGGGRADFSTSTDADGRFEIAGLAPGTWSVTASHPDWSDATASVEVGDSPATVDLRLGSGGSIGGVVLAAGQPVEGAQVGLGASGETGFRGLGGGQSALTDASGRFRFDRLSPGRYEVVASLRSQSSRPVEAVVTADAPQEVTLALDAGATIRGTVSGLPDSLLGAVRVSASGTDGYFGDARTEADGSFTLAGVPEGVVSLNATAGDLASGSRSARASVTVGPGQVEAFAEIVFEPGFRVEGRVSRGGQPVTDAIVFASPEGRGGPGASGRTDDSGSYVLEGLAEGTYTFVASSTNGSPIRRDVAISGDTTVDLEAPPARLLGTVVDAGTGRPLGDVAVRVEDGAGSGPRFMNVVSTDSSGQFAFEDLEPCSYRLSFQKPAYQAETRDVTATEDGTELRVELRRGEGLALEARDGIYGTPLRGLFVRALDGSGVAVYAGSVPLDSTGRGEVPSLKPGSYELRVDSSGYAPVVRSGVMVPSSGLSLALTPGGSIEIRLGPETLALPQPRAVLYGAGGMPYPTSVFSPDGAIPLGGPVRRLDHVAPGSYTLAVEGGSRQDVQVREGGAAVVELP